MKSDDIRHARLDSVLGAEIDQPIDYTAVVAAGLVSGWLREIAAQLAELNETLRNRNKLQYLDKQRADGDYW